MSKHINKSMLVIWLFLLGASFLVPLPNGIPIGDNAINFRLSPVLDSYDYLFSHWPDGFPNGRVGIVTTVGVIFIIQLVIVSILSVISNRNLMLIMSKLKSKEIDGSPNQSIEETR